MHSRHCVCMLCMALNYMHSKHGHAHCAKKTTVSFQFLCYVRMLQSIHVCCSTSVSHYRATAVSTGSRATTSILTCTSSFPCRWPLKEKVRGIWPTVRHNCSTCTCMSRLCCVCYALFKPACQSFTSALPFSPGLMPDVTLTFMHKVEQI